MMLFFLLAGDILVRYRFRRVVPRTRERRHEPEFIVAVITTIVGAATPILLASLGELVVEKSGFSTSVSRA